MLKKLHYGLTCVLDQVKKMNNFYGTSLTALSESKKKEKMLEDYHVLITQLTSENLKLTGEKLANKAEIEEMKKKNSEIKEGVKGKTSLGEKCFMTEGLEEGNNCSFLSSSESSELLDSWPLTQQQNPLSHYHTLRTGTTLDRSDDSNLSDSDWSSDSQDEESYKGRLHSLAHSLTHYLTRSLIHSLTHSLTHLLT